MATLYKLSGGLEVTRWWNSGSFRWTANTDTFDAGQIAELFELLDPVVRAALLKEAEDRHVRVCQVGEPKEGP
jgi:hypothetical protein